MKMKIHLKCDEDCKRMANSLIEWSFCFTFIGVDNIFYIDDADWEEAVETGLYEYYSTIGGKELPWMDETSS